MGIMWDSYVIMWKLINWPKVKQYEIILGSQTPDLKGNCQ